MGTLAFDDYLGGADQLQLQSSFPSVQQIKAYDFGQDVTGWTFEAEYQTIVVDSYATDKYTGEPSFSSSTVTGTFASTTISGANEPAVTDAANGLVDLILPVDMYTGPIIPGSKLSAPIVIFTFRWTDANSPANISMHRWGIIECWESGVIAEDPTFDAGYTPLPTS